jgi:hypothetical protein
MLKCKWMSVAAFAAVAVAALIALPSPAVVQAQTTDPATQLYVQGMGVTYASVGGPKRLPLAVVDIVDGYGVPVNGATVTGNWSGAFKENGDSDLTDTYFYPQPDGSVIEVDGRGEIWAKKSYSCWGQKTKPYFIFTITSVTKDGMTYVPVNGYGTSWSEVQCD